MALKKRQEAELEVAELKMLRLGFSLGVTRMDKIRNEYIRGTEQVGRFGKKIREARLRWFDMYGGKMMGISYREKDAENGTARKWETENA